MTSTHALSILINHSVNGISIKKIYDIKVLKKYRTKRFLLLHTMYRYFDLSVTPRHFGNHNEVAGSRLLYYRLVWYLPYITRTAN